MKLYKWLNGNQSCHAGKYTWSLPQNGEPGEWTSYLGGPLDPCARGYHLCRVGDLVVWLAPDLYEVETRGDVLKAGDKVVVRQCRLLRRVSAWDKRTARLFACDCAEHVLPIFEEQYPNDRMPREVIKTARRYICGEASAQDLYAARYTARAAAMYTAMDAAAAAAWDATMSATMSAAVGAVGAAARDAAKVAAWHAVRAAVGAAAISAAVDAVGATAWDAGDAVKAAVGAAASGVVAAAARGAVAAAARDAERAWQTQHLCETLGIEEERDGD